MLKSLKIENVALINSLEIEFLEKLNVLSGETGAGKSIIIDSINFVVGGKSSKSLIKQNQEKMKVEAMFVSPFSSELLEEIKSYDIEFDKEELLIKKTLSQDGKVDIKINGSTITNSMLKKMSSLLIDIHGQHEHQKLLSDKYHLQVVDSFIKDNKALKNFEVLHKSLNDLNLSIKKLNGSTENQERMLDLLSYQIKEIEDAKIKDNEDDQLFQKKLMMQNFEKIYANLSDTVVELDGQNPVTSILKKSFSNLSNLAKFDDFYQDLANRLNSLKFELVDIVDVLKQKQSSCNFDQKEFEEIDNRLDKIKNIKKKYGATLEDVQNFLIKSKQDYEEILNSKEKLKEFLTKKQNLLKSIYIECSNLSKLRRSFAKKLEDDVKEQLNDLGMKNSKFIVDFNNIPTFETLEENLNINGFDKVRFLFSANVGQDLKPLSEIISGGEASRFMLALKNIVTDCDNISTMIFDEIDTGISGEMGYKVACKLANISKKHQVMSVSHLPQICAMADNNLKVLKRTQNDQTQILIENLTGHKVLEEISRLSGGAIDSRISIEHARELKQRCNDYKKSN